MLYTIIIPLLVFKLYGKILNTSQVNFLLYELKILLDNKPNTEDKVLLPIDDPIIKLLTLLNKFKQMELLFCAFHLIVYVDFSYLICHFLFHFMVIIIRNKNQIKSNLERIVCVYRIFKIFYIPYLKATSVFYTKCNL